VLIFYSEEVFL